MKIAKRFPWQRMLEFDRAVRAGEYPNAASLARRLEVGRRTVQRDVEFLRDRLGAPLEFDPRRNGFFYSDPTFRLPAVGLTEGELIALFLGSQALGQYKGTPYAEPLRRALGKIFDTLTDRVTIDPGDLDRSVSFRTSPAPEVDPHILGRLLTATREGRRLTLAYRSASRGEATRREVDPYHLVNVDGSWYLVGFCHLRGEVRMFSPSRIVDLTESGATFEAPQGFSVGEYLGLSLGVLRGGQGERHRVRLRLRGEAARYAGERTWHPSQKSESVDDGELILDFELGHLREIERFALSWGDGCEVLDPPELRARVQRTLEAAAARYRDPP